MVEEMGRECRGKGGSLRPQRASHGTRDGTFHLTLLQLLITPGVGQEVRQQHHVIPVLAPSPRVWALAPSREPMELTGQCSHIL